MSCCLFTPQGLASVASGVLLWWPRVDGALTWLLPAWGQKQEPKEVLPTVCCGIRVCQVERDAGSRAGSL